MPRIVALSPILLLALLFATHARAEEGDGPPDAAPAEETAGTRGDAATVAAWDWWKATEAYQTAVLRQARMLREAAADEVQKEQASTVPLALLRVTSKLKEQAQDAFRRAFEASEPDGWDDAEHAEIVKAGLDLAARHALDTDPAAAVGWWERLLERFPDAVEARRVKTTWFPLALPSAIGPVAARDRLLALVEQVDEPYRPELLVAVGDTHAMEGAYDDARTAYEEARALIPDELDRNDPRGRLRGHLDLRRKLVGRPAPAIVAARWFGEAPGPDWAGLTLLDFTATWCGPCLKGLPHLEALAEQYADHLRVVALTREYEKRGVLPERPGLARELYRGTTREEYVEHLESFRKRVGMRIPLGLIEKDMAEAYPVRGLPTMVLIDQAGIVALVAVGGMRHPLLRCAVELLLDP